MKRRFRKRQLPDWSGASCNPESANSKEDGRLSRPLSGSLHKCSQGESATSTDVLLTNDDANETVIGASSRPDDSSDKHSRETDSELVERFETCRQTSETDGVDVSSDNAIASSSSSIIMKFPLKNDSNCDQMICSETSVVSNMREMKETHTSISQTEYAKPSVVKKKKKMRQGLFGPPKPKSEAVESFEKAISESLPKLKFQGEVVYSHSAGECATHCETFLLSLNSDSRVYVGFDLEWTVTFQSGGTGKVALVQICVSENLCFLFHIIAMDTIPHALWQLISDPRVVKVGLNIASDMWKLERDYDGFKAKSVIEKSVVELTSLANKKLKSSERWSLDGLCRNVLRQRLVKDGGVRYEAWHQHPLCDQQIDYATADAFASYEIYRNLASSG